MISQNDSHASIVHQKKSPANCFTMTSQKARRTCIMTSKKKPAHLHYDVTKSPAYLHHDVTKSPDRLHYDVTKNPAYLHRRSGSTRSARRWSTRSRCRCPRSRCSVPAAVPRAFRTSAVCSPPPGCGRRSCPLNHPGWSWPASGSRGLRCCRRRRRS